MVTVSCPEIDNKKTTPMALFSVDYFFKKGCRAKKITMIIPEKIKTRVAFMNNETAPGARNSMSTSSK